MTGAGWGGCTVTLLEKGAVDGAIQRIKVRPHPFRYRDNMTPPTGRVLHS